MNTSLNSLSPGKFELYFRCLIFQIISVIDGWGMCCEYALRWISLDLTDDESTLVQVMAWCCQATSHYLSQWWPRSLSPYGVPRPQWLIGLVNCDVSGLCDVTKSCLTPSPWSVDLVHPALASHGPGYMRFASFLRQLISVMFISLQPADVIQDLSDQIDSLRDNVVYVQENINECQSNIMQMEENRVCFFCCIPKIKSLEVM